MVQIFSQEDLIGRPILLDTPKYLIRTYMNGDVNFDDVLLIRSIENDVCDEECFIVGFEKRFDSKFNEMPLNNCSKFTSFYLGTDDLLVLFETKGEINSAIEFVRDRYKEDAENVKSQIESIDKLISKYHISFIKEMIKSSSSYKNSKLVKMIKEELEDDYGFKIRVLSSVVEELRNGFISFRYLSKTHTLQVSQIVDIIPDEDKVKVITSNNASYEIQKSNNEKDYYKFYLLVEPFKLRY